MSQLGCANWADAFEIRLLSERRDPCDDLTTLINVNTDQIVSEHAEGLIRNVVTLRHLTVDVDHIREEDIPIRETNSLGTLQKVLIEELRARRLHWEDFSYDEWTKSTLGHANPIQWVQQFAELGFPNVGKHLLRSLRVITDKELHAAFSLPPDETVGLRVAYAYIKDDEAGSSSLSIKNLLEHSYPAKDIFQLDLGSLQILETIDKDVVYVFEDGLWSGVELVKRLAAIHESESFRRTSIQLHFRYGATSDSGLIAARLFARREKSSRVQFNAAKPGYHFKFLNRTARTEFDNLLKEDDAAIRERLDSSIEPYAFREEASWGNDRESAISLCAEIGQQLVIPFLRRKKASKAGAQIPNGDLDSVEIKEDALAKWRLGASGFASTVVFATSIPKPVLPVMWLSGDITVRGKTIRWKPLFWDVRRTGSVAG
ncbi:Uncharacterised protein [Burkholderia pseudomallei]|nr:Uncharacterised protein [Burkholderia pseudomallei]CAJ8381401.1 Uncharacterised protein [Burkholderia pseudomallei]CAJ9808137.1 Uncharacterised protein [Burkholderia pseudomallei]